MVAESINTLGLLRRSEGRFVEAEEVLGEGLAMRRKLLGDGDMSVATSLMNLAGVYVGMERFGEAEDALEDAVGVKSIIIPDKK